MLYYENISLNKILRYNRQDNSNGLPSGEVGGCIQEPHRRGVQVPGADAQGPLYDIQFVRGEEVRCAEVS